MIGWRRDGAIAILTLDRAAARNAIPIAGWHAISAALAEIASSDSRALIVDSAVAGSFSAGADLAEFGELIDCPARRPTFRTAMGNAIEAVAAFPIPVLAAVDGGCFGAAVALTLACDIVVAGDAAVFATTPAKLGLSYPAADVARLKSRVGEGRAAYMLFTGDRISADAALAFGLAHVRAAKAAPRAHDLAQTIAANAPGAVRKLKHVLRAPEAAGHDAAFDDAFGSEELSARLTAFLGGKR